MLLATLGASLLVNMLANKREGEGIARVGYGSKIYSLKKNFLISPYPLTNFEIQMYYQNEPRFKRVYSRESVCN